MDLPQLDRNLKPSAALPTRILQFGEGNFLRAFADWMVQEMNTKLNFQAGVTVIQPIDHGMVDKLNQQQGLYTVLLTGILEGQAIRKQTLVECIQEGINPYTDFQHFLEKAHDPAYQLVLSNTTEAGIVFEAKDNFQDTPPSSFPAKLCRWLYERYLHFQGDTARGLIFLPCELIDQNGSKLYDCLNAYIAHWKLPMAFAQWLDEACTFCNTLVDRIVPGFPKDQIRDIQNDLGYRDDLVTEGERFHLWVIEGPKQVATEFPAPAAGLNVLFTKDLSPYRTRKVRILNGAHTAMVPLSYLYGLRTVQETVEHKLLGQWVRTLVFEEVIPTLDLPQEELNSYAEQVLERFRNPYIKHHLISIALNSISKFKTRVLPSLLGFTKRKGKLPKRLVWALAALIQFYKGVDMQGNNFPLRDDPDTLVFFQEVWKEHEQDLEMLVRRVLGRQDFWDQDLNQIPELRHQLKKCLEVIEEGVFTEVFRS